MVLKNPIEESIQHSAPKAKFSWQQHYSVTDVLFQSGLLLFNENINAIVSLVINVNYLPIKYIFHKDWETQTEKLWTLNGQPLRGNSSL